jgi:hypothetical protein
MKHSHTPLLILAIAIVLVVGALYGYMYNTMSNSVLRAGAARDIVATEQHDQAQAKNVAQMVSDTAFERARLPDLFVSSGDIVSFITSLESLGPQSGSKVVLASIDADQMTNVATGTIGHAKAHINGTGPWAAVMKLLALAERLPYASTINHVHIDAGQASDKGPQDWSISFDVQALVIANQ